MDEHQETGEVQLSSDLLTHGANGFQLSGPLCKRLLRPLALGDIASDSKFSYHFSFFNIRDAFELPYEILSRPRENT